MKIVFDPASSNVFIGATDSEHAQYSISEEIEALTSGSVTPKTHEDLEYNEITPVDTANMFRVIGTNLDSEDPTFRSYNESVATIDSSGLARHVADGEVTFGISSPSKHERGETRTVTTSTDQVTAEATGYATGSVAETIYNTMLSLVSGLTAGNTTQQRFSSYNNDFDAPAFIPNANFFASAYDWSGVSIRRRSHSYGTFPVILIGTEHAICANHISGAVGDEYMWRRPDGTFATAKSDAKLALSSAEDICVLHLDTTITGCAIYNILESGWGTTRFPSIDNMLLVGSTYLYHAIPTLCMCTYSTYPTRVGAPYTAKINNIVTNNSIYGAGSLQNVGGPSRDALMDGLLDWGADHFYGGESGSPSFIPWSGELVLVSAQHTTLTAGDMASYISDIESAMDTTAGAAPGTWSVGVRTLT